MNENDVQSFGNAHPCGDHIAGGLHGESADDYDRSFTAYDTRRYGQESHLPACLDEIDWRGLKVPESGLGQGSESKHLIRRGASWSGPDLTHEPVDRVRARLAIRASPHDDLQRGSVLAIPWPDDTFDLVFSHGVLHHVPKTQAAQREIHRVLKPGGGLVAMLYARGSLNYQLSIKAVCRVMLAAAYPLRRSRFLPEAPMLRQHLTNAETQCLRRYLAIDNVTHRNSDGPLTPTRAPTRFGRWPRISRTSNWSAPTRATCLLRRSRHAGCVQERASLLSLAPENLVDPRLLVALIGPLRQYGPATMDPV